MTNHRLSASPTPNAESDDIEGFCFPQGYWKRPDVTGHEKGDENPDDIFLAVGRALTNWEITENALMWLYLVLTSEPGQNFNWAVRAAWGKVESSALRFAMTKAAAELYFGGFWSEPEVNQRFKRLGEAVHHASHRRNEIAHGLCHQELASRETDGYFLGAPTYVTDRNDLFPKHLPKDEPTRVIRSRYLYTAADVTAWANKFRELFSKTMNFIPHIQKNEVGLSNLTAPLWERREALMSELDKHRQTF